MKNKNLCKVKLFDQISLSDCCKSVILGCILGHGSLKLYKGQKSPCLSIKHSIINKEYLLWKISFLTELHSSQSLFIQESNQKLLFQSNSHLELHKLYHLTYKNNQLAIQRKWLNRLTPLSLAVLWCDIGSLIGNRKKGVFCTDELDEKSVILLSRYLLNVWDIKTRVGNVKKVNKGKEKLYPRIWINTKELKKFIEIIKDHVPTSMKRKIEIQ